jgi:hypothetical protein
MCYVEDSGASHGMQMDCAALPGAIPENYDCGHDDYFNPSPPAGSYLATHWNTYDSALLAPCGEITPACGGGTLWVPTPPAATTGPSVAGIARRGNRLSVVVGGWSNSPSGFTYQWQRLAGDGWQDIEDATAATYIATTDDLGLRLRVMVAATNDDGTASAASTPTAPVGASGVYRAAKSSHKWKPKKVKATSSSKKKKHKQAKASRAKHKHRRK